MEIVVCWHNITITLTVWWLLLSINFRIAMLQVCNIMCVYIIFSILWCYILFHYILYCIFSDKMQIHNLCIDMWTYCAFTFTFAYLRMSVKAVWRYLNGCGECTARRYHADPEHLKPFTLAPQTLWVIQVMGRPQAMLGHLESPVTGSIHSLGLLLLEWCNHMQPDYTYVYIVMWSLIT